jgi:hypothetical protein
MPATPVVYTIHEKRIVRAREYVNRAEAMAAVGLAD